MDTAIDIARQVEERAKSLLPPEERPELETKFVKQCLDANERGDGVLFATIFQDRFLLNVTPKDDEWFAWRGNVWEPDDFKLAVDAVEECALEYQKCAEPLKKDIEEEEIDKKHPEAWKLPLYKKYAARVDRLRGKDGAKKALYWAPVVQKLMACREGDFNQLPWLLPVKNGVIDLKRGILTQGRPADMMSKALDLDYNSSADYTLWEKTIVEICGSKEVAAFLKRVFGYAITGHSFEQYIFVFIGPGRNGKGILFSMIGDILGPFYHEIRRAMILQQRNEPSPNAATEHLYSLLSKRIIVGAETNKGQKIDEAAVKGLTGEDRITCRPNFKSEVSFLPTHTLFLHTNHVPHGLTSDFAMRQRILLIEFPFMYVDDPVVEGKKTPALADKFKKKNPKLKEELHDHREGILRWLVEGCQEWQEQGLSPPQSIVDAVDKLAEDEDYVGQFIKDCLELTPETPETRLPCTAMYAAFEWWWSENIDAREQRIPHMKTVNKTLVERGFEKDKVGGKTYLYGVMIRFDVVSEVENFVKQRTKS